MGNRNDLDLILRTFWKMANLQFHYSMVNIYPPAHSSYTSETDM